MDYYKNADHLGNMSTCFEFTGCPAVGIQYYVVNDLATEPVDVPFFKKHVRIDFNVDDNLLAAYLKAARQELEQWSQLSFGVKTMRLRALQLPNNFRLMFGRVDSITTTGYTNFGDILKEGGKDVEIEYTTLDWINEAVKIAICRYAAGLYVYRENIVDTEYAAQVGMDEAKEMLKPYMNVTLL